MQMSIDRAGRVVIPKPLREQLGLTAGSQLEAEVVGDHLEITARRHAPQIVEGPDGPVLAATGTPLGDDEVRAALEAAREHR